MISIAEEVIAGFGRYENRYNLQSMRKLLLIRLRVMSDEELERVKKELGIE